MNNYEEKLALARQRIAEADAIVIGAGAGLSAAAGLDYSGPAFKKEFADYIKKYGFPDLYTSSFHDFPTEEERWARWARHIDYIRFRPGAMPLYKELYDLVKDKNYFVITTNVDAQFRKAGFNPEKIFEVQGDYGQMQCAVGCHPKLYSDKETVEQILAHSENLTVPKEYVPVCPVCGGNMDVHVRKNQYFVQDEAWHAAADRYERFMDKYADRSRVVLLELGIGYNTPAIIRYPFERITYQNPGATLIRLNADYPQGPAETASRTISFTENMGEVIDNLKETK
ncbi:Sir2 family NAD-dependent protein deacetylase [uncultured Duncaniella sp.]|uniref:Sir2 family NAD-dependent protein deacetylase n=1 Tax=uncultured Duncaniella sp. TaxID=2768039 RepID=UPI0025F931B2|nr:Sir2 family NAD-dependent protein deacetylase [uncultured Duncaniella sp.]